MAGILMAEEKGRKLIPQQALALSVECAPNAFARVELNYEQAIAYLRHEALQLPNDAPRGYVIVTYASHPLGFVNNLGNRANNLYPAEWRIRN
jgi:NOL1/NOP2/fmu family ribosome biogenesis protein